MMYQFFLLLVVICLSACEQEQQGSGMINNFAEDQSVEDQMQSTSDFANQPVNIFANQPDSGIKE
jgi:hypothetical protein